MILIVCLLIQPLPTIPIKIVLNVSDRCWQHKNTNKLSCSPTNNNLKKKELEKGQLHTQECHFSVTNKRDDTDVARQYTAEAAGAGATPPCPDGSPWKRQPDPRYTSPARLRCNYKYNRLFHCYSPSFLDGLCYVGTTARPCGRRP